MYSTVLLVISYSSLLCALTLHPISLHSGISAFPRHFPPMPVILNEPHLSSLNEHAHCSTDSWEQRGAGRARQRGRDRIGVREMLDTLRWLWTVKPYSFLLLLLWLFPNSLLGYFWGPFKIGAMGWRHWRGRGGAILCVCLCECVSRKGGHLVLLRQWISTLIGSRVGDVCACMCMWCSVATGDKRRNTHAYKITQTHAQAHSQTQMWNH